MSKPNILWISTHDTSAWHYGCYGDTLLIRQILTGWPLKRCATPTLSLPDPSAHLREPASIPACIPLLSVRIITAAQ